MPVSSICMSFLSTMRSRNLSAAFLRTYWVGTTVFLFITQLWSCKKTKILVGHTPCFKILLHSRDSSPKPCSVQITNRMYNHDFHCSKRFTHINSSRSLTHWANIYLPRYPQGDSRLREQQFAGHPRECAAEVRLEERASQVWLVTTTLPQFCKGDSRKWCDWKTRHQ